MQLNGASCAWMVLHSKPVSVGCGNGIVPGFFGGNVFSIPLVTSVLIHGRP